MKTQFAFGILVALASTAPSASAAQLDLKGGETATIIPNVATTVSCSGGDGNGEHGGHGHGGGEVFDVDSSVDVKCVERIRMNTVGSNYVMKYDNAQEALVTCRNTQVDQKRCFIVSGTASAECEATFRKVTVGDYYNVDPAQAKLATEACKTIKAKCRI